MDFGDVNSTTRGMMVGVDDWGVEVAVRRSSMRALVLDALLASRAVTINLAGPFVASFLAASSPIPVDAPTSRTVSPLRRRRDGFGDVDEL